MCAEPEAADQEAAQSAGAKAGKALAGAAVTGLYTGLKFTGLAVRVASGLAASIGKDAEKALSRAEASRDTVAASAVGVPAAVTALLHSIIAWTHGSTDVLCCLDCLKPVLHG